MIRGSDGVELAQKLKLQRQSTLGKNQFPTMGSMDGGGSMDEPAIQWSNTGKDSNTTNCCTDGVCFAQKLKLQRQNTVGKERFSTMGSMDRGGSMDEPVFQWSNAGKDANTTSCCTDAVCFAQKLALQKSNKGLDDAFLVYDPSRVYDRMAEFHRLLPRVQPFYAVKCNSHPALLQQLALLGAGFDAASMGEIDMVLGLPVEPDRIIYANPCKSRNDIRHATKVGVTLSTFDNEDALKQMALLQPQARLLLRISVPDETAISQFRDKYGCDPVKEAPFLLRRAAEMHLSVVGVAFHVGGGCQTAAAYIPAIQHSRQLFGIGSGLGHKMRILDIGGGFPGFPAERISFEQIADVVNAALDQYFPYAADGGFTVMAEPGQFLAAPAFYLCCNVIARTRIAASRLTNDESDDGTKAFKYFINESTHGTFSQCVIFPNHEPVPRPLFARSDNEPTYWSRIWGQTCDGADLIRDKYRLPELREGDWLIFDYMGSYSIAAASTFNGLPRPNIYYAP